MDFKQTLGSAGQLGQVAADALVVVVFGDKLDAALDPALAAPVQAALDASDFVLKAGRTLDFRGLPGFKARRVVLAVAGKLTPKAFKTAAAGALALLKTGGTRTLAVVMSGVHPTDDDAEAWALAVSDAAYSYRHTKPSAEPPVAWREALFVCEKAQAKAVAQGLTRGAAIAAGVNLARELANRPANHATPSHLAETAQKLGEDFDLKVQVLDRKACEKLGMGAFLAVAQGSDEPPRFIVARYQGSSKSEAPVVLVGKGITFDTGGISLKPGPEMDEMKFDMGGAASVLGTLRAVAALKPKINLVVIVPTCENMPSGRAVKPGDVVTSMSGQTIEILNTDAEGRLILCDALTYAERFKPAAVVDVATLTGACVIALGHHHSGLYASDETLARDLLSAGEAALDTAWRMPLDEEYEEGLKSNFADIPNIAGRAGGSITAALFLKRFTGAYKWAHLDIAGTAWKSGASKGATGRPVGLLTHFVLARARQSS
jgi:leucyl aminopeptidase